MTETIRSIREAIASEYTRTGVRPTRMAVSKAFLAAMEADAEAIMPFTTESGDDAIIYGVRLYAKD